MNLSLLKAIIASCLILSVGCTFAPKLTMEEISCPNELTKRLEDLSSAVQTASSVCNGLGDFKDGGRN